MLFLTANNSYSSSGSRGDFFHFDSIHTVGKQPFYRHDHDWWVIVDTNDETNLVIESFSASNTEFWKKNSHFLFID